MNRIVKCFVFCLLVPAFAVAQTKVVPDINESTEYPNVIHSPSATSTPPIFESVFQLEVAVKESDGVAAIRYANGVAIGNDDLIVCVLDQPGSSLSVDDVLSADVLLLDGTSLPAEVVHVEVSYGIVLFRAPSLNAPALEMSDRVPVAKRRLSWHAVYQQGNEKILYSRPLQIHKAQIKLGEVDDLCEVIDIGSSALSAERSGSALLSLDGRLVAIMGRQTYWNVPPKNVRPRSKVAWAVPVGVLSRVVNAVETRTQ